MITTEIIADSVAPSCSRLTTFLCTYPRYIHAEVMTHRVFARNASSSRAIPVQKMLDAVTNNPVVPIHWGRNQKGMQAESELTLNEAGLAKTEWLAAAKSAVMHAERLKEIGVHKQVTNRLLEPFLHITTLISATEWGNFFNLRVHKDAQPEIQALAAQMLRQLTSAVPVSKQCGEWHLPFADKYVEDGLPTEALLKISPARAARVSYMTMTGDIDHRKDFELHDRLSESGHWSPFEHSARAMQFPEPSGCFRGWMQYRKQFSTEHRSECFADQLLSQCQP